MQLVLHIVRSVLVLMVSVAGSLAQTPAATQTNPERAYLSPEKYTNAFFGFSVALPPAGQFAVLTKSSKPPNHFLFGLEARQSRITGINIIAEPSAKPSAGAVRSAISREDSHTTKIKIGGKDFWRAEAKQETAFGKQEFIGYGVALDGYILEFQIVSISPELTEELDGMVRSLFFFDPQRSREIAGPDSRPYPIDASAIEAASNKIAGLDPGTFAGNTYSNSYLGFSYRFPANWKVADKTARERITFKHHQSGKDPEITPNQELAARCTRVLFWAAKYPQSRNPGEFDPFVLVAIADPECLSSPVKFPASVQDHAGLQEFTQTLIQSYTGTALLGGASGGVFKVRATSIGGHLFVDVPTIALTPVVGSRLYKKIHMSLAVTEIRNYWLMWAFASDSLSELHDVMKISIVFTPPSLDGPNAQ